MEKFQRKPDAVELCVFGLLVMTTWTLVIKFLAPLLWAYAEHRVGNTEAPVPIMWDFWWVAHLALAHLLWFRHRYAWGFALIVTVAEILVVVVKFVAYFQDPDLTFWRLLWFTNKVYVLFFFVVMLVLLFRPAFRARLGELDCE